MTKEEKVKLALGIIEELAASFKGLREKLAKIALEDEAVLDSIIETVKKLREREK